MGNTVIPNIGTKKSLLEALANVCGFKCDRDLGSGGMFMPSHRCSIGNKVVALKVCYQDHLDLKFLEYLRPMNTIMRKVQVKSCPNLLLPIWPDHMITIRDEAKTTYWCTYLMRQYTHTNLKERLGQRPRLTETERHWIAYQMIAAVDQCHQQGVCHGDVKLSNFLLTSHDWVLLADFAFYKPTYAVPDGSAEHMYRFFFGGTWQQNGCCIAPERVVEQTTVPLLQGPLTPAMDLFSLGCSLYHLYSPDASPLFDDLSQLLQAKQGASALYRDRIARLADPHVQDLVAHLVCIQPDRRRPAHDCLAKLFHEKLFHASFNQCLHGVYERLNPLAPEQRILSLAHPEHLQRIFTATLVAPQQLTQRSALESIHLAAKLFPFPTPSPSPSSPPSSSPSLTPARIPSHDNATPSVSVAQTHQAPHHPICQKTSPPPPLVDMAHRGDLESLLMDASLPEVESVWVSMCHSSGLEDREALLVAVEPILRANLRSVRSLDAKLAGLDVIQTVAPFVSDAPIIERLVPLVGSLVTDAMPRVRTKALAVLCRLLASVRAYDEASGNLYSGYVLPLLSKRILPVEVQRTQREQRRAQAGKQPSQHDHEEIEELQCEEVISARCALASHVVHIAHTAFHTLTRAAAANANDSTRAAKELDLAGPMFFQLVRQLFAMQESRHVTQILMQRGNVARMATLFGTQRVLSLLMAHAACVDWQVRTTLPLALVTACNRHSANSVALQLASLFSDTEEQVAENAMHAAPRLIPLLTHPQLTALLRMAVPLVLHPNASLRRLVRGFFLKAARHLGPVGSLAFLVPILQPFAHTQGSTVLVQALGTHEDLQCTLHAPVPRRSFHAVVHYLASQDPRLLASCSSSPHSSSSSASTPSTSSSLLSSTSLVHSSSVLVRFPLDHAPGVDTHEVSKLELMKPFLVAHARAIKQATRSATPEARTSDARDHVDAGGAVPQSRSRLGESILQTHAHASACGRTSMQPPPPRPASPSYTTATTSTTPSSLSSPRFPPPRSPLAHTAASRSTTTHPPAHTAHSHWMPDSSPLAHLHEHRKGINALAAAHDGSFFLSGSDDGTVKVWDPTRCERDPAARSRLTYESQEGRITSLALFDGTHRFVSGSDQGSLHVVDVASQPLDGMPLLRFSSSAQVARGAVRQDSVLQVHAVTVGHQSLVLYATQQSGIHALDLNIQEPSASVLHIRPEYGCVTALCAHRGADWLLAGTDRGFLALYDIRYQLPVSVWRHRTQSRIHALTPLYYDSAGKYRDSLVCIASGRNQVAVIDLASPSLTAVMAFGIRASDHANVHSCFTSSSSSSSASSHLSPSLVSSTSSATHSLDHTVEPGRSVVAYWADDTISSPFQELSRLNTILRELPHTPLGTPPPEPSVRALWSDPAWHLVAAAGSDSAIRVWDVARVENSMHVGRAARFARTVHHGGQGESLYQVADDGDANEASITMIEFPMSEEEEAFHLAFAGRTRHDRTLQDDIYTALSAIHAPRPLLLSGTRNGAISVFGDDASQHQRETR